jgi:hypothetical protein
MALDEPVYLEQMALVTGYRHANVQEKILALSRNMGASENREAIRNSFVDYLVKEDQSKFTAPSSNVYRPIAKVGSEFAGAAERSAA